MLATRGRKLYPRNRLRRVTDGWKVELLETPYGKMLKLSGEKVKVWMMGYGQETSLTTTFSHT